MKESPFPAVLAADLFALRYGKALVATSRAAGEVPVYGSNGQCGWHDSSLFKGPGVILGRKGQGPLGVEWCDSDYWVIDTAYTLQLVRSDVDLKYAYYLVKYVGLNHLKDGTSNPSLSRDTFRSQIFPLPSFREQSAIAHILGALDDKIELNRKMNETLEEMARALFKSWFVDFDPVHAKAAGKKPYGMDDATAALFPNSFEESELGLIPRGWRVEDVGKVQTLLGGGTPSTSNPSYWEGGTHPWTTPKDLSGRSCVVLRDVPRKITDAGLAKISSGLLPIGTLLLSSRAPVGYLAITAVPLAINQGYIAMPPEQLGAEFLLAWCETNMERIKAAASGTTFAEISKATFRSMRITVPTPELLRAYAEGVRSLYQQVAACASQSEVLAQLRDTLLPKLLSGDLRIKDAQSLVDELL